jgi:protein-tyrosine phosphatase
MNELRVLFVCRANECRSTLAEAYFRVALRRHEADSRISVSSAGVRAVPGSAMPPEYVALLDDGTAATFRSRRLTADLVSESDVVVAMTLAELAEVLRLWPRALARTVTLTELARAAAPPPKSTSDEDRLVEMLSRAIRRRGTTSPLDQRNVDIPDPAGRASAMPHRTAETVRTCNQNTAALWPAAVSSGALTGGGPS